MRFLLEQNVAVLSQTRDLLARLTADQYTQPIGVCFNSTLGGHVRHLLDHYHSFFSWTETGKVDYENRQRERRLETDLDYARTATDAVIRRLELDDEGDATRALLVRVEDLDPLLPDANAISSVRRELLFLLSHTVHHCALIAVCCQSLEVPLPASFGVAPSTLRHRAASA